MHAVIVNVAIANPDSAIKDLNEQVVPRVKGAPGFVAGYWVSLPGGKGSSIAVFDSESAAQAVAGAVEPTPESAVTIESVTVGEVIASA